MKSEIEYKFSPKFTKYNEMIKYTPSIIMANNLFNIYMKTWFITNN